MKTSHVDLDKLEALARAAATAWLSPVSPNDLTYLPTSNIVYLTAFTPEVALKLVADSRRLAGVPKVVDDLLKTRLEQCWCTETNPAARAPCDSCMEVARVRGTLAAVLAKATS